ncbi:adenosylcobinamide-GDP ribazoletransferase [Jiella endophytica]|nr:adenosylcobinamide-GDP ribazoletransferase [Jiella endophytica]
MNGLREAEAIFGATLRAAAFFTRLSISGRHFKSRGETAAGKSPGNRDGEIGGARTSGASPAAPYRLGDDAHAFPLVGLIAAAPAAILLLVLPAAGLSPLVCGILALAALVAMTGALHEDGLADVADGLFGHQPRERALEIMHDSRVGSYGAIALILSLGLRAALLAELCASSPLLAACAVLAAGAAARGAMAAFWALTPSALDSGLAARAGQPSRSRGRASLIVGLAIGLGLALPVAGPGSAIVAILVPTLVLVMFRRFILRRIGGQTGDCLGAAEQLCEMAVLLVLAATV